MHDGPQDPKDSSANIVPLGGFLSEMPEAFRQAVRRVLEDAGFDLENRLPNLQLTSHLFESLAALQRYGEAWSRFSAQLETAGRRSVLMDLGSVRRS